jgi:hypothetical protein
MSKNAGEDPNACIRKRFAIELHLLTRHEFMINSELSIASSSADASHSPFFLDLPKAAIDYYSVAAIVGANQKRITPARFHAD